MTFKRFSEWALVSEDGKYTISAAKVMGRFVYQAWFTGTKPATQLGRRMSPSAAQNLCCRHAGESDMEAA